MFGSRGAFVGSGGVSDGYEVGSKRQRMIDSNPYLVVGDGGGRAGNFHPYHYNRLPSFPVVRLRGLPFSCTDMDVFKFFTGLDTVDVLLVNRNGRFSGEAFAVFATPMQAEVALQRDRQNIGERYVEVFRCKKQEYYHAIAADLKDGCGNGSHRSPPPNPIHPKRSHDKEHLDYTEILKLRGLPFSVTKSKIMDFFSDFKLIEDNIHIACRLDGKATGEAYVEFVSVDEARRAMSKDKLKIGSRYVELFPSTPDEARRAESRSRQ